jgi:two-component sensor histidine kinase
MRISDWRQQLVRYATASAVILILCFACEQLRQWQHVYGMSVFVATYVVITATMGQSVGIWSVIFSIPIIALVEMEGEGFAVSRPEEATKMVLLLISGTVAVATLGILKHRMEVMRMEAQRHRDELAQSRAQETRATAMLQELTHRVGNDLSTLSAIANIKAARMGSDPCVAALHRMRDRIHVFASLYRKLSMSTARSEFSTRDFIRGVCHDLSKASFGLRPITLAVDVDDIELGAQRAVLVGIMLNETINNCVKYAFPDDRPGSIQVALRRDAQQPGWVQVTVRDNGVGPAAASDPVNGASTGMGSRILESMAAQLHGNYRVDREGNFTVASMVFPLNDN